MTKEERLIFQTVNLALEAHGRPERAKPHPHFPMRRTLQVELHTGQTVRVWTALRPRRVDLFTPERPGTPWGNSRTIGDFSGTGWLPALAQAVVDTVASPPSDTR